MRPGSSLDGLAGLQHRRQQAHDFRTAGVEQGEVRRGAHGFNDIGGRSNRQQRPDFFSRAEWTPKGPRAAPSSLARSRTGARDRGAASHNVRIRHAAEVKIQPRPPTTTRRSGLGHSVLSARIMTEVIDAREDKPRPGADPLWPLFGFVSLRPAQYPPAGRGCFPGWSELVSK